MKAPSIGDIHTSANLEMDFFGTPSSLPVDTSGTDTITEAAFYVNPALRVRHAWFKIETPVVDLLFGQYWNLYGWQPVFFPNTIDLQGLPGQVFSRSPQIRASKTMHFGGATLEAAIAASRPAQRDTATPTDKPAFALRSMVGRACKPSMPPARSSNLPKSESAESCVESTPQNSPPNPSNSTRAPVAAAQSTRSFRSFLRARLILTMVFP